VIALLEPLFERPEEADESFAEALEMLFAAYLVLGRRRQRQRLVERLTLELRPPLRARAWARRATMLADQGRHDEAWLAWERAHHDDPDDEALMQLEVTLLLVRGRLEQAAERARFHVQRIGRAAQMGVPVDPEVLALLSEAIADPAAAAWRITGGSRCAPSRPRAARPARAARRASTPTAVREALRPAVAARRSPRPPAAAPQYPLLQLKVTIAETRPPIWRRLRVSGAMTLADFHRVLQVALGWTDNHLHLFTAAGKSYGDPSLDLEMAIIDERGTPLGALLGRPGDRIRYEYDFGDSWIHRIQVEELASPAPEAPAAICLGGRRRGPPEDCGGASGYDKILAILAGGDSAERRGILDWLGGEIDPGAFDAAAINRGLARIR
jgi:tetratricopeptide (TPR) repeat protein